MAPMPLEELSLFFPCRNEAENLEALVADALAALPALATRYEVILVDDGSTDATPEIAARLVAESKGLVRLVRHDVGRGYGGALRSGFSAARLGVIAFTDGDRQFRVADLRPLIARLDAPTPSQGAPSIDTVGDVAAVVGFRIERADPLLRRIYAAIYRTALRLFFGLSLRDVDCAAKVFRRNALEGIALESRGAFFSAELMIKIRVRGVRIAEVGVPHYPRMAGAATGARPSVVLRAVRDFWKLRIALWVSRSAALRRGLPLF